MHSNLTKAGPSQTARWRSSKPELYSRAPLHPTLAAIDAELADVNVSAVEKRRLRQRAGLVQRY